MAKPQTLTRPPIKEAILEVLFKYPEPVNLKFLSEYGKRISSKYSHRENIITINANISHANENVIRNNIGYAYFTSDKKTSTQIRVNGFAFAQTNESYTSWESFKPIAIKELQDFIEFSLPMSIDRFSLRFINEIKLSPLIDLKESLRLLPNVDTINLPLRNFVCRMEMEKPEIGALAIISQLFSPPFEPTVNVYLDIDVMIKEITEKDVDLNYLSEKFDLLREFKNDIFFSALTEQTINSYI